MEHSREWIVRDLDDAGMYAHSSSSASNRERSFPSGGRLFTFHFVRERHDLVGHSQATRANEYKLNAVVYTHAVV